MAKQKVLVDREKLNGPLSGGCAACGKKFSLGEFAVLACGAWDGAPRFIHEREAVFDGNTAQYYEQKCYNSLRPK